MFEIVKIICCILITITDIIAIVIIIKFDAEKEIEEVKKEDEERKKENEI